jgi:hypothetical protein
MKRLRKFLGIKAGDLTVFEKLWLAAPIFVWFSFQPLIRIGQNETMYFELSIALIYVAVLGLVGLPSIWTQRRTLLKSRAAIIAVSFVAIMALSLFWTPNITRGILTVGVAGLLLIVFLGSLMVRDRLKRLIPALTKLFLISAVVISALALVQMVAGIWLDRDAVLLCAGCVAEQFGYVRPNVFTIEPQFLGNMLLAPALIGVWLLLKGQLNRWAMSGVLLIIVALFLTMSRGAIFALAIGLIVLFAVHYKNIGHVARAAGLIAAAFIISLLAQGSAAALHPTINETFAGAVSKSINQLSLGLIDIPVEEQPKPSGEAPNYDGYVEESTNVRLNFSDKALDVWNDNPLRILFGIGLGGSGVVLNEAFPGEIGSREIVQNEFISLLLEVGLVGLVLFTALVGILLYRLGRSGAWWGVAITLAFIAQWNFFSGYPNALHIYLVLIICAVYELTARHGQSVLAKQY